MGSDHANRLIWKETQAATLLPRIPLATKNVPLILEGLVLRPISFDMFSGCLCFVKLRTTMNLN